TKDAAVRQGRGRRLIRWTVLPLQKRKRLRIEQFSAAPTDPTFAITTMHQPEERQKARPGATALVHRIGMERGIIKQVHIWGTDAIALVVERPRFAVGAGWDKIPIFGIEEKHKPEEDG